MQEIDKTKIKLISFDMDNTLVTEDIDDWVWNEEIPKLYAKKNSISLKQAKLEVYAKYYEELYITKNKNWTDLYFWFDFFKLNMKDFELDFEKEVNIIEGVIKTLDYLKDKYELVITTNSSPFFIKNKMKATKLEKYFKKIYSAQRYSNTHQKDEKTFKQLLKDFNIKPSEIIHVGDNPIFDKQVPEKLNIKSLIINPNGKGDLNKITDLIKIL